MGNVVDASVVVGGVVHVMPGSRRVISSVSVALTRASISCWETQTRDTVICGRTEMTGLLDQLLTHPVYFSGMRAYLEAEPGQMIYTPYWRCSRLREVDVKGS